MFDGFANVRIKYAFEVLGPFIFRQDITAPNINSSGSFSHCHVCEADQATDWSALTGRLVESTGQCAVRDDAGVLVSNYSDAPGMGYAMASVQLAQTSVLGVLLSVEEVQDSAIDHAHGITLSHAVAEEDGYKMLRVCGAGDCFVWTVRPLATEVPLTPLMLGGLYTKYENGVEQADKVVINCNSDFSFVMLQAGTSNDALSARVSQLEAIIQQLTNS